MVHRSLFCQPLPLILQLNRNHDQVAVRQHSHAQTQLGGESNGRYANEPVVLMNMVSTFA